MEVQAIEFQKKLQELVALARTKKNILEYKELQDFFDSMSPSEQQYDRIIEYLAHKGIDVLKISDTETMMLCFCRMTKSLKMSRKKIWTSWT